jgi:hypothetical protein
MSAIGAQADKIQTALMTPEAAVTREWYALHAA